MSISAGVRAWLVDISVGVLVGGVLGVILALNIMIFAGPTQGYESSLGEVFEHSTVVGLSTVAALIGTPLLAIAAVHNFRSRQPRVGSPRG